MTHYERAFFFIFPSPTYAFSVLADIPSSLRPSASIRFNAASQRWVWIFIAYLSLEMRRKVRKRRGVSEHKYICMHASTLGFFQMCRDEQDIYITADV